MKWSNRDMQHWRASAGSTLSKWATGASSAIRPSAPMLLVLCLVTGASAQWLLDQEEHLVLAGCLYLLAAILFVIVTRQRRELPQIVRILDGKTDWRMVLAACILGVLSFPRFSGNLFSASGVALWAGGLLLIALATRQRSLPADVPRSPASAPLTKSGITVEWRHLALIAIIGLGAFYRLYKIDLIPLEMGCDLPHIYNNIRLILRHEFLVFFPSHPGREGLFFYLAAPLCSLFGLTHTNIKIASALVGVATMPAVYLLGKELYDRETGLFAAFFLSISHWHIILTRIGWRIVHHAPGAGADVVFPPPRAGERGVHGSMPWLAYSGGWASIPTTPLWFPLPPLPASC